jgi:cytochrome P450
MVQLMHTWGENFVVRFPLPWSRWVFLHEPQAVQALLEDINPEKAPDFTRGLHAIAKGGLLTAPYEAWLVERRRVAPTMTERYVGDLHQIFEEEAEHLWARLEDAASGGTVIEMDAALVGTLFDVIARITIGRSLGFEADARSQTMTRSIESALDEAMRRIVLPPGAGYLTALTPAGRQYRAAMRDIDALLDDCVQQRIRDRSGAPEGSCSGGVRTDLLGVLLDAFDERVLTLQDVKDQLLTFLLAGHDTTAHTLTWMLWEIARDPDLQEALAAEAHAALPLRSDFPRGRACLAKLDLLDRVWQEALRKHPVAATGTLRQLHSAATVPTARAPDGTYNERAALAALLQLPAHAKISIPPFSVQRNPRHWPDPERFDPRRFEAAAVSARHPFAFQVRV